MNVSDNAMTILQKRYLWPGETPEGMLRRVADTVGAKETREVRHAFFDMMDNLEFLPNSPTLMNAGKPDGQLAACFVLPVEDSMESIMAAATAQAMVFKSGGGCIGGESTIITDKGPIDIKTFCEKQMRHRVLSFDASTGDTSYKSVSAHHITPLPAARIYEVKMSGGCSIRASDWHPFFVWNGTNIEERRADHLKKGDVVIGSTKMAELTAPDWQAWLIGLILSDGAFDFTGGSYRYRRLRICKGNEAVIARAAEVLGCNYSLSSNSAYCAPVWELAVSGKRAEKIFESFGAEDVRCSNKRIPEWVWDSGASSMLHLLIGLLDGDGWYCNNKHRFCYDTISEELAKDVMALCGYLGIPSSMRKRIPRRHNEQLIYEISIRTNASLLEAADRLSTRHAGHLTGYKKFAIPVSLEYDKRLKEYYGVSFWKADWWKNGIPMDRGKINILRWHHDGLMPINSAAMLLRKIGESNLAAALDSAHVVKSVSVSEKDDTLYDLTVPGTQTYVAGVNGFCVVHNTGFDFSKLRPEGSPIRNSIGTASGPVSFMELFDKVTDVVKAGGGRRGANMGILRCDHPDIEKFVRAKTEQNRLTNFNISVMATDEWMNNPGPMFDLIAESAWKSGDPGLLFYDTINRGNTTPWLGDLTATNPCGESPLYPYEACNLGSINMAAFVRDGGSIDYKRLEEVVRLAVRFLDDVIDVNAYPLPEIEKAAKRTRKIGLGIMGWADTLIMMGIPYGSDRSIELAHKVWGFVDETAYDESRLLAAARGAYPAFQGAEPIRNATRTCIAPTGTISLIADVSSGIEPVFAFEHTRMAFSGEAALKVVHPLMERAKREGWYDPEVFVDAHHVPYRRQIEMQAAFQEHTDLAVSKTINLPSSATVDDVRDAYLTAWKAGCKGITVYRDGCRDGQVLVAGDKPKKSDEATRRLPHSRPEGVISGKTSKMPTSFGNLYVTLNYMDGGRPIEAFSTVGKSGADMESCTEAIGRLMSLALRYEIPIGEIIDQLKGISGAQPVWDHNGKSVLSIPDGIARCLEELTGDVRTVKSGELCPECGGMTERGEGCVKCPSCGWSRC